MAIQRIAPPPNRESPNLDVILLAAATLGAVLVLARQVPYGVGLHWDSGVYLAAARSLLDGAGLRDYAGGLYLAWPPLYPLLLAVASLDVLDPLAVAGPVNAALFGLTVFVAGQYLRRRLESRFLAAWAAFAIALAWPLANQAAIAMSGTALILLLTLTLIHAEAFLAGGGTSSLVWAGVFAALTWQTRFIGATLPAAVVVMLLLQRGVRPAQRVRRAAGFGLLAGTPMALWLVRNWLLSGTVTGPRPRYGVSLPEVMSGTGELLWTWATSFDLPLVGWQAIAYVGLLPAAAACGILILVQSHRRQKPSDWLPCYVFGGFALTYLTGVVILLTLVETGVAMRFLNPLYVPLLLTAAFALDRIVGLAPRRRRFWRRWKPRWRRQAPRAAAAVVTAALCFHTAGQIKPNVREIRRANSEGAYGYASPFWAGSETLEWIRRNPLAGGPIISNEALVVSIHNYSRDSPAPQYRFLPTSEDHLEEFLQAWLTGGNTCCVVWFDDTWVNRRHEYGSAALHTSPHLEPVAELADGTVFKAASAAD